MLYLEYRHLGLEVQFIIDYNFFICYLLAYKGTFLCNVKLIKAIKNNWFYIRFGWKNSLEWHSDQGTALVMIALKRTFFTTPVTLL